MAITAVTLTNLDQTVYRGLFMKAYDIANPIGPEHVTWISDERGDNHIIPVSPARRGINSADGSLISTAGTTELKVSCDLDDPIKVNENIGYDQLAKKAEYKLPQNMAEQFGENLASDFLLRFVNYIAGVASAGSANTSADILPGTTTDLGANTAAAIRDLAATFTVSGVPETGRYLLLYPDHFYALTGVEGVMNVNWGGNANAGAPTALFYNNFTILPTGKGLATDSSSDTNMGSETQYKKNLAAGGLETGACYGVAWHKSAMAVRAATMKPETSILDEPLYDSWMVKARWHVGMINTKLTGIRVLHDDGS